MSEFIGSIWWLIVSLGVLVGQSTWAMRGLDPLFQILRTVPPLAWLPLITLVVSALYTSSVPWLAKSFVTSALTVTLCSLWPTLINTAVGVAGLDRDLHNVSRVLRLSFVTHVRRIVLRAPDGATIEELTAATGWQSHTVRGAMAGALKKKLGLEVTSEKVENRGRVYSLPRD